MKTTFWGSSGLSWVNGSGTDLCGTRTLYSVQTTANNLETKDSIFVYFRRLLHIHYWVVYCDRKNEGCDLEEHMYMVTGWFPFLRILPLTRLPDRVTSLMSLPNTMLLSPYRYSVHNSSINNAVAGSGHTNKNAQSTSYTIPNTSESPVSRQHISCRIFRSGTGQQGDGECPEIYRFYNRVTTDYRNRSRTVLKLYSSITSVVHRHKASWKVWP